MSHEIDVEVRKNLTEILNSHGYDANGSPSATLNADSEPIVADESVIPEQTIEEPVLYDAQDQENFTRNLLTSGESGKNLYRQINSDGFINETGTFTAETINKAKEHGLNDSQIQAHQEAINKQLETQRNELFAQTGESVGYMSVVTEWAFRTFTNAEKKVLNDGLTKDAIAELKNLERYYQSEMSK